jgi:hypothetical protein
MLIGSVKPSQTRGHNALHPPGRKVAQKTVKYDKRRYKRRNRPKRMFGRLKIGAASQLALRQITNSLPLLFIMRHFGYDCRLRKSR